MSFQKGRQRTRHWYLDALSSLMALALAFFFGRSLRGLLPLGLLTVLFLLGVAYFFGRSAWRGLLEARG